MRKSLIVAACFPPPPSSMTAEQIAEVIRKMPSFAPNLRAQRESCATAFANQLFPSDFRKAMDWRESALSPVSPTPVQ